MKSVNLTSRREPTPPDFISNQTMIARKFVLRRKITSGTPELTDFLLLEEPVPELKDGGKSN